MKRNLIYGIVLMVILFCLTACSNNDSKEISNRASTTSNKNVLSNTISKNEIVEKNIKEEEKVSVNYAENAQKQMAVPTEGETVATIHVRNFGDIKVKFFKDIAPKAVENFVKHAKDGYYNGVTFHRVINEFMIQGGDPEGTGMGGESIWGSDFEEELSEELVPYRGSLCMASRGLQNSPSLGSQFFITQANYNVQMERYLSSYPQELIEQYKKYGGYLSLYMQYTVFGQVYEGMDVVDKIAAVSTDTNDKPIEDVVIDSIDVKE